MKNKCFKLLFLAIFLSSCTSKESQDEQTQLIYRVLNDPEITPERDGQLVVSDKSVLPPPTIPDNYENESDFIADVLGETDKAFIKKQLRLSQDFRINDFVKPDIEIIPTNGIYDRDLEQFLSEENINGFYSVSMPIFNRDKSMAYIRVGYICGPYCGGGQELVMEKSFDSWRIHKELGVWVN